jgi:Regulator of ribonuclease activity B
VTVGSERHHELLSKQLAMNQQTWQTLQQHGVTEGTELRLDFNFIAPSEEQAKALADLLQRETDYDVRVISDGGGLLRKKRWRITGTTQPTSVSQGILDEWVTWMVAAGFENGCEFDGWGAQVPRPTP